MALTCEFFPSQKKLQVKTEIKIDKNPNTIKRLLSQWQRRRDMLSHDEETRVKDRQNQLTFSKITADTTQSFSNGGW